MWIFLFTLEILRKQSNIPVKSFMAYLKLDSCLLLKRNTIFERRKYYDKLNVIVIQGLKFVINNRLSHALLKNILPNVRDLVHDDSEKVRRAFLELLLAVKGVRSIKVRMQHLYLFLGSFLHSEEASSIGRLPEADLYSVLCKYRDHKYQIYAVHPF